MTRSSSPSQATGGQPVDRTVATDDAPRFAILGPLEIAVPNGGRLAVGGTQATRAAEPAGPAPQPGGLSVPAGGGAVGRRAAERLPR